MSGTAMAAYASYEPEPPPLAPGSEPRRPCVLLAEDDREMRMLIATTLRRGGWDVIEACDGHDLLDCVAWVMHARDDLADGVLLSDVRMPGMGGFEALARLRHVRWPGRIVVITAFGDEKTHARAYELGAAVVLDKPFELDDLLAAMRTARGS